MRQHEAVIKVMLENKGFATLGHLYSSVLQVPGVEWNTKTPFASIRRIVQDEKYFFKIRPGLWALNSYKDKLPFDVLPTKDIPKQKQEEFNHAYFQGLLLEIGNMKKFETCVPNQDKNSSFLGRKLGEIATASEFYKFTYEHIIQKTRSVDVTWFNVRKMPYMLFEVEYSTDIKNSLSKFVELQDFNTSFHIVADEVRKREFEGKLLSEAFRPIQKRVKFLSYDDVSKWHTKTSELANVEESLGL